MRTLQLVVMPILLVSLGAVVTPTASAATQRASADKIDVKPLAGGGCKSVATFISSAVPELKKDGCTGCHGGANPAATSALNLGSIGKDNGAACSQALARVNLANKPQSAIIQAAAGSITHLGGKVTDTQPYTAAMLGWINNE